MIERAWGIANYIVYLQVVSGSRSPTIVETQSRSIRNKLVGYEKNTHTHCPKYDNSEKAVYTIGISITTINKWTERTVRGHGCKRWIWDAHQHPPWAIAEWSVVTRVHLFCFFATFDFPNVFSEDWARLDIRTREQAEPFLPIGELLLAQTTSVLVDEIQSTAGNLVIPGFKFKLCVSMVNCYLVMEAIRKEQETRNKKQGSISNKQ